MFESLEWVRSHAHRRLHSSAVNGRPRIASTSASIIRNCSTEYSLFDGMVRRCPSWIMKECLVPARGPSKPSTRSRRTKSRRLQGVHRLMNRLAVEINTGDHGQRVSQFHSKEYPIFQG